MLQKRNLFILLLFLTLTFSFSQERIGSFKNDLKISSSFIKEIIPIANSKNNDVAVFIADAKNVYGYKLNDTFEVSSKITSEEKRRKYKTLLGYSIPDDDNYKIFLTNKAKKKFLIVDFYFTKNKTITKEFTLDDSAEEIIQTISLDNKFYLITTKLFENQNFNRSISLNTSFSDDIINIYTFDEKNNLIKKEIDLAKHHFTTKKGRRIRVRSLLLSTTFGNNTISKIDTDIYNTIEITAKTSKLYIKNKNLIFSFDEDKDLTQVLKINLNDYTVTKDTYPKKLSKAKASNSFILDDNIFIASGNKEELYIEVLDRTSKKKLKTFSIYEDKEITIKNSPIIQRGGAYANYRELKTTKQFLRKITADKFGLSVLKVKDTYELSIGGYSQQARGGGMMMGGFGGIPIGGIGGASLFFNPTMFAYNASSGTKSTQIDCLFDLNFEHLEGEISENTFDKIDDFLDRNNTFSQKNIQNKNKGNFKEDDNDITEVFKQNNQTVLGSYDKNSKTYYFYKF